MSSRECIVASPKSSSADSCRPLANPRTAASADFGLEEDKFSSAFSFIAVDLVTLLILFFEDSWLLLQLNEVLYPLLIKLPLRH